VVRRFGVDTGVVRPDFYVYAAVSADELPATLAALGSQLGLTGDNTASSATEGGDGLAAQPLVLGDVGA
jgi:hypothetical protein